MIDIEGSFIFLLLLLFRHSHDLIDCLRLGRLLQQTFLVIVVLHVERLNLKEFLYLIGEINYEVMLELLLHELRYRGFDFLILGGDLLFILELVVKDFDELPFSFIERFLREFHEVIRIIFILVTSNLNNEDTNWKIDSSHQLI